MSTARGQMTRKEAAGEVTDVIVVGGGAGGITAALVLARARHRVVLIDDHTHRNASVEEFHGFPTRDSTAPRDFRSDALAELRSYDVRVASHSVVEATQSASGVSMTLTDGSALHTSAVLLATGVQDQLPTIDGLAARWGRSAFNCPFCDGWEQRDRDVVVIDAAPGAEQLAELVRSWTANVAFVAAGDVEAMVGEGTQLSRLLLRDGTTIPAAAAFVKAPIVPRSSIARSLGCELDDDGYIVTTHTGATSNPHVWAAGDVRRPPPMPHQVVLAAADGSAAGIDMHKAIVSGLVRAGGQLTNRTEELRDYFSDYSDRQRPEHSELLAES